VSTPLPSAVVVSTPLVERLASAMAASMLDIDTELGVRLTPFLFSALAPSLPLTTIEEEITDDEDLADPEGFPEFGLPFMKRNEANVSAASCSLGAMANTSFALTPEGFFPADFLRGLAFKVALCNFWAEVRDFVVEACDFFDDEGVDFFFSALLLGLVLFLLSTKKAGDGANARDPPFVSTFCRFAGRSDISASRMLE
jgi:hypothetical protein